MKGFGWFPFRIFGEVLRFFLLQERFYKDRWWSKLGDEVFVVGMLKMLNEYDGNVLWKNCCWMLKPMVFNVFCCFKPISNRDGAWVGGSEKDGAMTGYTVTNRVTFGDATKKQS